MVNRLSRDYSGPKKARKDEETSRGLDKLEENLKNRNLHVVRGSEKLEGTKTVFYRGAGGRARLYYRYSKTDKPAVEIIGTSGKNNQQQVIDNLQKNYE